nr:NADH dehydrogenase subunit 1 [Nothopoda sp.]
MSIMFLKIFLVLVFGFLSLAFLTLLERKVLSFIGLRLGPNKVLYLGLFQPIFDAIKISNKQTNMLSNYSFFYFYFSSFFLIFFSLLFWFMNFYEPKTLFIGNSSIFLLVLLTFHTIFSMFIAWSSIGKFSVIASLRITSQLISYEGVIYMIILFFFIIYFSYNFYMMYFNVLFFFFPFIFFFWIFSILSELGRTPFDFGESESELVSGFNLEYGSVFFSFIFMAEYSSISFFSLLSSYLFFYDFFFFFFFFFFGFVLFCLVYVLILFYMFVENLFFLF